MFKIKMALDGGWEHGLQIREVWLEAMWFIRKRVCPSDEGAPAPLSLLFFLLLLVFLPHPLFLLLLNDRGSLPWSSLALT